MDSNSLNETGADFSGDPDLAGMDQAELTEYAAGSTDQPDVSQPCTDLMGQGFVAFYRVWRDQWWWLHRPWSYAQVFLFMLMDANGKPRQHEFEGEIIMIPRGALYTSVKSLHEQSGLDRKTVTRFLSKLKQAGEIKFLRKGQNGIVVSLCNYECYQIAAQMKGHRKHSRRDTKGTSTSQP